MEQHPRSGPPPRAAPHGKRKKPRTGTRTAGTAGTAAATGAGAGVGAAATAPTLRRLTAWFAERGWQPWPFQRRTWQAYRRGESGLVSVPTGAGKTYAAYFGPLAEVADTAAATANGRVAAAPPGLRILYVTPLRAVARDIEAALRAPVEALGLPVRVESRTGDTPSAVRSRQRNRLPDVLVTTPESLSILLAYADAATLFAGLRCVIVDEWHELLASKRGTQTELALARLRRFAPGVQTWGMSATLANLAEAAQALVGTGCRPTLVRARMPRPVVVESLLPPAAERLPWGGHLGMAMFKPLLGALDIDRSTLIFVNTRSQAERWYQALTLARPEWESRMALHHGSLDREERERVEHGVKHGALTLVVCTSSLDLGVDFAPVERVFQIGSPKGVARLIQRAGRAAHRPGAPCHVVCVPTHGLEVVEIAAAREAVEKLDVEPRVGYTQPLDVLAQHLVTCALGGGFTADALYDEVRTTAAYRDLPREDFDWTLALVRDGGATLHAYDEYRRVAAGDDGVYRVPDKRTAQLHRMNIGTITTDGVIDVRYARGAKLGTVEESFIARLAPGDAFVFAGRLLEFVEVREMTALVRDATRYARLTPRWGGSRFPLSTALAAAVRRSLHRARQGRYEGREMQAAEPMLRMQARLSRIPAKDRLLVEEIATPDGYHLFLYPFEGRLVHEGLAALLALRLTRQQPATFALTANDYGLEVLCGEPFPYGEALVAKEALFATDSLAEDILASLNLAELAKRQFREVARVAGLVHQSYPGQRKTTRYLQASTGLLYEVFRAHDPDNLLLMQARREVLERQLERSRLAATLSRLCRQPIEHVRPPQPTPLAFPLIVDRIGTQLTGDDLRQRIERMKREWEPDDM